MDDLNQVTRLNELADDINALDRLAEVRRKNKLKFAAFAKEHYGLSLDVGGIFDVQAKQLHQDQAANAEIFSSVGDDNCYRFGMDAAEVRASWADQDYDPWAVAAAAPAVQCAVNALLDDLVSRREPGIFGPLGHSFFEGGDRYRVLADFASYQDAQARIDSDFQTHTDWTRKSMFSIARTCKFSSYCPSQSMPTRSGISNCP